MVRSAQREKPSDSFDSRKLLLRASLGQPYLGRASVLDVHPRAVTLDARVKLRAGILYRKDIKVKKKKRNRSRAVLGDRVAQCRK